MLPEEKCTFRGYNTAEHPRHPPLELKLEVLHRCFELGEDVQLVSNEVGVQYGQYICMAEEIHPERCISVNEST